MSLLEDIQHAAVDASGDLATLLRKCKVLAARLGNRQLENWLIWESNGYPEDVPVPKYRVWSLQVKGNFMGPFYQGLRNVPIPLALLRVNVRASYKEYECRPSIATVESTLKENEGGIIGVTTNDLSLTLGTNVFENMNCLECWAGFSTTHLVELLNTVRVRALDFSLAIWKENPNAGEANSNASGGGLSSDKITQIFNTTVYGGDANLVGTANDASVAFIVAPDDIESMRRALRQNGVFAEDVTELEKAIAREGKPQSSGQFGPKVSTWIAGMMKKASEGTWSVGIAAAGNILAKILSKFYGF